MKKAKYIISVILAAIVIFSVMILFTPNRCRIYKEVTVTIPQGSSLNDISEILKDRYIISSRLSFMTKTVLSGKKSKLRYGDFNFSPNMTYNEIIDTLCNNGASKKTVTVTIPEGYSIEMIINKMLDMGIGTDNEFKQALNKTYDYKFLEYINPTDKVNYKLQGFLFPSTYEFFADATAQDVINTMLSEFEKQYSALNIGYENLEDIIIKASLIEREAKIDSEREIIAGVIENRIKADMPLQLDATVVYAISDGLYNIERVYYKDLETDSKYNTYKYKGLPIGPICNPGIKSIEAALNPQDHDYLYYHTDTAKNDGSHIFSKTYEEHNSGLSHSAQNATTPQ